MGISKKKVLNGGLKVKESRGLDLNVLIKESNDEREHNSWVDNKGNKLILGSVKGKWHKILQSEKEDRLFFITINESEGYFITHEQQIQMMTSILYNDILDHAFNKNIRKFEVALTNIKENRGL